jgi:hypothetical protein
VELAWADPYLAVFTDVELDPVGRIRVDLPLVELAGAPLLLGAGPARTRELPSPNTTIRKTIAIRLISLLLQLLPHGPHCARSVRLTILIVDLRADECKRNCPDYQT